MCKRCNEAIKASADLMRSDLLENRLEVVLIPSNDPDCAMRGGMIRAVQSANPRWYSEFCRQFPSSRRRERRKFDTKIKRQQTLRGLEMLAQGRNDTEYTQRLRRFIRDNNYPLSEIDW